MYFMHSVNAGKVGQPYHFLKIKKKEVFSHDLIVLFDNLIGLKTVKVLDAVYRSIKSEKVEEV